jgi:AbrB family looped-hinge helix DNA binding protein
MTITLVRVKEKAQVTLPDKFRRKLGINCGDYLEVEIKKNKMIFTPKILIDKEEVTLSKEGEKKMEEALKDIKEGRIEPV